MAQAAEDFSQILSTFKFVDSDTITTFDWQTYRTERYGYEVSYPSDWSFKGGTAQTIWTKNSAEDLFFNVNVRLNYDDRKENDVQVIREYVDSLDDYVCNYDENEGPCSEIEAATKKSLGWINEEDYDITIDGLLGVAYKYRGPQGESSTLYYVQSKGGGGTFEIEATRVTEDEDELLGQILSTFKFIEPKASPSQESLSVSELLQNKENYLNKQVTIRDVVSFDFLGTSEEGGGISSVNVSIGPSSNGIRLFQSNSYVSCQTDEVIESCGGFERDQIYEVVGVLKKPGLTFLFEVISSIKQN